MIVGWTFILVVLGVGILAYWQSQERRARMAREWRRFRAVTGPEAQHVRILGPVGRACVVFDWQHLDPRLRVPPVVEERGEHAAA